MIITEKVQGTQEEVLPVEMNVDTVYIRDNITQKIDDEGKKYWEYNERQMSYDEYLREAIPINNQEINQLKIMLQSYQKQMDQAIAELSIIIGGK